MLHANATGSLAPKKIGSSRQHKLRGHDKAVRELVTAVHKATLDKPVTQLGGRRIETILWDFTVISAISALSFKKTPHASEQDRAAVMAAREAWRTEQPVLDA